MPKYLKNKLLLYEGELKKKGEREVSIKITKPLAVDNSE